MTESTEFKVEATPVLSREDGARKDGALNDSFIGDDGPAFDLIDDTDLGENFADLSLNADAPELWDQEKTQVLTDLDAEGDLTAFLLDIEGNRFALDHFPFKIGRDRLADLNLSGPGISRSHAEIIFESGRFVINDLGSVNGIRVNGYKVSRVILEDNDLIKIGDVSLKFGADKDSITTFSKDGPSSGFSAGGVGTAGGPKSPEANSGLFNFQFGDLIKPLAAIVCGLAVVAIGIFAFQTFTQNQRVGVVSLASTGSSKGGSTAAEVQSDRSDAAPVNVDSSNKQPRTAAAPSSATKSQTTRNQPASPAMPNALTQAPLAGIADAPKASGIPSNAFIQPSSRPAAPASSNKSTTASKSSKSSAPRISSSQPVAANDPAAIALIAKAESQYLAGRGEQYIDELESALAEGRLSTQSRREIEQLVNQFDALNERYETGNSHVAAGDRDNAVSAWLAFIELERQAGFKVKSDRRREAEGWLGLHYFQKAEQAQAAGDYHQAYILLQKSVNLDSRTGAKVALANVNARAKRLYRRALRLEYVNSSQAKENWREVTEIVPANNEYHIKSKDKLAWYNEWTP